MAQSCIISGGGMEAQSGVQGLTLHPGSDHVSARIPARKTVVHTWIRFVASPLQNPQKRLVTLNGHVLGTQQGRHVTYEALESVEKGAHQHWDYTDGVHGRLHSCKP